MSYQQRRDAPGYWTYAGLPVQADVEVHQLAQAMARQRLAPGARVLDVAAGHGALSRALLDAGMAVSCTSWNDKVALPVPQYRIDLDLPFGEANVGGTYEMAFALEIIEHVENAPQFLRSLAGVLRPGGWLALSTPNVESVQARLEWLLHGCPYSFGEGEIRDNRHINLQWRAGLEAFIDLAGFEIVEKHLVGEFKFRSRGQAVLKGLLYRGLSPWLRGDLRGTSRLYLLRRGPSAPMRLGSDDVA
jgi:SAM-dependent methyltransferase